MVMVRGVLGERRRFRDRRTALGAAATLTLAIGLELSDGLRATRDDDRVNDAGTGLLYLGALACAIGATSRSLLAEVEPLPRRPGRFWAGLACIWAGAGLNRWARQTLGQNYRSRLTIVHHHVVVDRGPYGFVRHPMYLGASLFCLGAGVALDSPSSATWSLPVLALVHRIRVEEDLLADALGDAYVAYVAGTKRLVPGVW